MAVKRLWWWRGGAATKTEIWWTFGWANKEYTTQNHVLKMH